MNAGDRADPNHRGRQKSSMKYTRLVCLSCAAVALSVFSLSSAVPPLVSSESSGAGQDRSLKLVAKNPAYWSGLEIEEGTLPAWVGRDGRMRVPRAFGGVPFSPASTRTPGALRDLIDRDYGVVLPAVSDDAAQRSRRYQDDYPYSAIKEFLPSFRQSWNKHFADATPRSTSTSTSPCAGSSSTCRECYRGYLSPTPTNPDGSDIFLHDLFDPSESYPPASNYSEDSLAPECSFQDEPPGYLVCSDAALTEVPRLPREKLSIFQLNDTSVATLRSGHFDGVDVVVMKLDSNSIATIEPGAFTGISNLLTLSLDNNQITSVKWTTFAGLDSLVVLSLRNNVIRLSNNGFQVPPNHTNATSPLLPGLAYLNLANNQLGELDKYVFWDLADSQIADLNLKSCNISAIHPDAFEPLRHVIHIDLYENPLLIHNREQLALKFSSGLLQLGLGANRLVQNLPTRLFSNAAASLSSLNLSGNLFFFMTSDLFPPDAMPNLTILVLEGCSVSVVGEGAFRGLPNLTSLYLGKNQLSSVAASALPATLTLLSITKNPQRSVSRFSLTDDNLAHLKQLLWLDMSYMDLRDMTPGVFNGLSRLLILQVRGSGLASIPGGVFSPLSSLLVLDLGDNIALQTLPHDFSAGLGATKILFLDHCNLDLTTSGEENATTRNYTGQLRPYEPFREMAALELLLLNNNNIRHFSASLVANLTSLYVLVLRGNLLQSWETGTTAHMSKELAAWTAVDASNNRITILPNRTYEEFINISAIDLSDNALTCNCETYDLKRLADEDNNTTVCYWDKPLAYTCTDTTKEEAPVIKEIPEMSKSEFNCPTSVAAYAIGTAVLLSVLLLVVASVCYYKRVAIYRRWFVYWHGRSAIDRTDNKRRKCPDENGNRFEYDAFISFNENDRPWVYTHLVPNLERNKATPTLPDNTPSFHLCLHDRDFTAGQRITENIVDNISKSRKVVIVLSRSYVDSKWCQFELHLSQHRLLESERRGDLILVVLEDVPKQQLNVGLRYLMRTRTYLAWRGDADGQRTFWKRLRQDLMDGCSQTLDSDQTLSSEREPELAPS